MPVEITMPQLTDTMTEGTVVRWSKKEGDKVRQGEEIAEVARRLFAKFSLKQKIRLIGVSVGDLHRDGADPQQLGLFPQSNDKEKLSRTVDEIKQKFGADAVRRGSQLR